MKKNLVMISFAFISFFIILLTSTSFVSAYTCTDSDGGKTYSTKGTVVATTPPASSSVDQCSGASGVLTEYFCASDKTVSAEGYKCPYGCYNGACRPPSICTDSDNGNYSVKGHTFNPTYSVDIWDKCFSASTLTEYICDPQVSSSNPSMVRGVSYACPGVCSDGACVSSTIGNTGGTAVSSGTGTTGIITPTKNRFGRNTVRFRQPSGGTGVVIKWWGSGKVIINEDNSIVFTN